MPFPSNFLFCIHFYTAQCCIILSQKLYSPSSKHISLDSTRIAACLSPFLWRNPPSTSHAGSYCPRLIELFHAERQLPRYCRLIVPEAVQQYKSKLNLIYKNPNSPTRIKINMNNNITHKDSVYWYALAFSINLQKFHVGMK